MSSSTQNEFDRNAGANDAEETLRLIASLTAPEGIEDRVKSGLRVAPRQASLISWPLSSSVDGARRTRIPAIRAAAAAAIVFVVAGGGWEVYSHIRLAPAPTAVAVPQLIDGSGGLSAAGAKRTPKTLQGPVVVATPSNHKLNSGNGNAVVVPQVHRSIAKSRASLPAQR